MKENITYKCGHEGIVEVYGARRLRESKLNYLQGCDCPECIEKKLNEEAEELGLPEELTGSPKQVRWAKDIRMGVVKYLDDAIAKCDSQVKGLEQEEIAKKCFRDAAEEIKNNTSARWWIDNKDKSVEWLVAQIANRIYEEIVASNPVAADATAEATVHPENEVTANAATIKLEEHRVTVSSDYDRVIIDAVKAAGLKWDGTGRVWMKTLNATTGRPEDRAAEIGNALLRAGVPVIIYDEDIRSAAINANFEPVTDRWVSRKDQDIVIRFNRDDELYNAARKITGSKYKKGVGVIVPASSSDEILDFAELYGFSITDGAKEAFSEYKSSIRIIAEPKKLETDDTDHLKEILETSSEVLPDLRDE